LEPSVSGGDDVVGVGASDEWFGFGLIVLVDETIDSGLQVDDGSEDTMLEAALCQLSEEAFDRVQP